MRHSHPFIPPNSPHTSHTLLKHPTRIPLLADAKRDLRQRTIPLTAPIRRRRTSRRARSRTCRDLCGLCTDRTCTGGTCTYRHRHRHRQRRAINQRNHRCARTFPTPRPRQHRLVLLRAYQEWNLGFGAEVRATRAWRRGARGGGAAGAG